MTLKKIFFKRVTPADIYSLLRKNRQQNQQNSEVHNLWIIRFPYKKPFFVVGIFLCKNLNEQEYSHSDFPLFDCDIISTFFWTRYIQTVNCSHSSSEGFSAWFGFFPSARKFYFSSKSQKLAFFATHFFQSYFLGTPL